MNHMLRKTALLLAIFMLMILVAGCAGKTTAKSETGKKTPTDGTAIVQRTISPVIGDEPELRPQPQASETPAPEESPKATEDTDAPEQGGAVNAPENAVSVAYVSAADVNVRSSASPTADILGKLALNAVVYVTKKDAGNDWTEISYNGTQAYIAGYYLKTVSETGELKPQGTATVNDADINLRADTDTSSEVLGKVTKDDKVDVLKKEVNGDWTMILKDQRVAFIASRYLDF